ncbi:hypothetical protein DNTS_025258 [Danionella cerebrum]|uniref:Uncharacterized protein n=1 Tax=Danionella cerebrum TaxID=2873325 RepID=A0A553Q1I7_9TELE|nr:hypothetical protein DNTS_025258 [Danionella translucida]
MVDFSKIDSVPESHVTRVEDVSLEPLSAFISSSCDPWSVYLMSMLLLLHMISSPQRLLLHQLCMICSELSASVEEVARWEHRTRGLTRLFGGPYVACYSLAALILLLNVYRSHSCYGDWVKFEERRPRFVPAIRKNRKICCDLKFTKK